ncbi:hypothetical protein PV761_03305 [Arthrobacter sp. CC3]|uniref:hypothetical protein n=1 Tax=Arthrobacter sp. CC3 TaxID=3029185 RepID=UPI003263500F
MIGPTVHPCISCHNPINANNVVICYDCITALQDDLLRVDLVVEELRVTVERQDVGGEQCGTSGTKLYAPAPINLSALDCEMRLHKALMGWCLRLVTEHTEVWHAECKTIHAAHTDRTTDPVYPARPVLPGRTIHHLTNYLYAQLGELRSRVWAADIKRHLVKHLAHCVAACERMEPKIFAGVCPEDVGGIECGTYVYEPQGAVEARCKTCGNTWDIVEWTGRALLSKEYVIGYPPALSRMLSSGGAHVTEQDIRNWAARGQLDRANPTEDDKGNELRPMYRLGDVLDAWQAHTSRKQAA